MIRRFCDACGTEIEKSCSSERLVAERLFRLPDTNKRVGVTVECLVTIDGTANAGDICRDCVIDTVNNADTRTKEAL